MNKPIKVGSDCAGVGAFPQSLKRLNINFTEKFACDFDYYARVNYCKNYGTDADLKLALSKEHKRYADKVKEIVLRDKTPSEKEIAFLNEANEFAKKFSFYFPFNMYQREIPEESLDIYVGSFPCQSFSLAGIRKGEEDKRGVLFYCGHDFIEKNRPRYFLIENVKGLLSDDGGRTFQRWIDYLGGKSVNGTQTMFPEENSVPYHVYYSVLNAKDYGVPQNRERIFIIGIRDDSDNNFNFPKPFELKKRLKDVLEENVDEKYYLKYKILSSFKSKKGDFGQRFKLKELNEVANCLTTKHGCGVITNNFIQYSKSPTNIRFLTQREYFRLMDFPDTFDFSVVSDSQAYKQAGSSIVVNVLAQIISKFNLNA